MLPWILLGYAVGSVPFAFLLARRAGIDVRVAGSGNVGAANVLRTSGTPLGVTVMALDISKGVATVLAAYAAAGSPRTMAAAGAAAVIGHIYPVWLRFHGGKGVAVAAGAFAVLAPLATLIAAAVFFSTVWLTRIISLGSVVATKGGSSMLLDGMKERSSRVIRRACSSESAAKCATPDFALWVIAPPNSSLVTSSCVTVLITSGPVMNI